MSTTEADISTLDDSALTSLYDDLLDQASDADDETLDEITDRQSEIEAEREARAKKHIPSPADKVETPAAKSIADQLADLREQLTKAEEIAKEAVVPKKSDAGRVEKIGDNIEQVVYTGDEDWKEGQLTRLEVAAIKQEIADLELRLPFAEKSDDVLLTEAEALQERSLALNAEVKELDAEERKTGIEDTSLKAQRLRRDAAAARAELTPMMNEIGTRKREAAHADFSEQAAARKALKMREDARTAWAADVKVKQAELDKSVEMNAFVSEAADALAKSKQSLADVESLISENPPPYPSEIERAKQAFAEFKAKHQTGRNRFEIEV